MGITVLHRDLQRGQRYSPLSKSKRSTWIRCWKLSCTASKYLQNLKTQVHSELYMYLCSNISEKNLKFLPQQTSLKSTCKNTQVPITEQIGCPFFWGKTGRHQGRKLFKIILLNHNLSPASTPWRYNVDTTSLSFQWPTEVVIGYYRKIIYFNPMPKGWTLYKISQEL